jgi:hypothetical protein
VENDWREVLPSGTSFATPLVSFAAALIKAEANKYIPPMQSKRRLLASSDLHPGDLATQIPDGRVLNVVKAVAIYHDILQLKDKSLIIGDLHLIQNGTALSPDDDLTLNCVPSQTAKIRVRNILKIWPDFDNDGHARVYAMAGGDQVMLPPKLCELPSDLQIEIIEATSKRQLGPYSAQEVRDIVPRLGQ